jgi:DNA-directed RNA polymerase subunit RPC12/RpoP
MAQGFGATDVTVWCPHCRYKMTEPVERLRANPMVTCLNCGKQFKYEGGGARLFLQSHFERLMGAVQPLIDRFSKK